MVDDPSFGAVIAFRVLPIVIFVSSVSAMLYHLRVIQFVVKWLAVLMQKTMKISGAESLGAALFIFFGIESLSAIGKYVREMTRSELFVVMTAFLATIAGSVMGAYVSFGAEARHLIAASLMSAPAAIVLAKIMIPETKEPPTAGKVEFHPQVDSVNLMDAAASGASQGVHLAINIAAMLIAFVALVAMVNFVLQHTAGTDLRTLFGYAFAPFAVAMGIPFEDAFEVGQLLGVKTALNEFLAYQNMQQLVADGQLQERSIVIATYALCGFANFGSIAILLGGIRGVAPSRTAEAAGLALKALVAGTLAAFSTACIAGVLC